MSGSERAQIVQSRRRRPFSRPMRCLAVAALTLGAASVTTALASGGALTLGSASSPTLGEQVLVNAQGHTLYALSPEKTSHLLCKTSACFKFWPPLTVRSRSVKLKAGAGIHGRLGILRRSNGLLQVTLRGLPLYRFLQDHAKGETNGENIESFGGTWHAVTAAANTSTTMPATPTPAPTPMPAPTPAPTPTPTPGYGY
jgi:predicted lipoprotein with Yx(FWY)xxD motif